METEGREDTNHEPENSTWPWIPDPTNVPAPLLQRPLDAVSDWISSEELCDVCSRLAINDEGHIELEHRTAKDLERVAGAAVRTGEACCPLCALIWKRMRDHFVYYYPNRDRQETYGNTEEGHAKTFEEWADVEAWHSQGKEVDEKTREVEFSRLMSQNGEKVRLDVQWTSCINIIHEASLDWPRVEFSDPDEPYALRNILARALHIYTLPDAPSAGKVGAHIPWRNLIQAAQYTASWTRRCLQNHTMCPKSIESPLPKRLIDVGVYGTSDRPRIWINPSMMSETKGGTVPTPIRGTYLALSYCWGPEPFEVIGPHNLRKMTEEISVKSLPRTIQDAMEFTRLLGVRYLWVDSLCILQGESVESRADWNEESMKMHTIYRNALLTIGAAKGKGAHDGIRPTADHPEMPFCSLPNGFGGTERPGQLYLGLKPIANRKNVIHTRAWTFQEFLLSARYINLGDNPIYWYCKQLSWNRRRNQKTEPCPPIPDGLGLTDHLEKDKASAEWHRIVDDYTSRSISRAEDWLIALSGVAKDLWLRRGQQDESLVVLSRNTITHDLMWWKTSQRNLWLRRSQQDEYLAGLWRNTITHDLMWKTSQRKSSPLSPTLPSWSWASQNKHVFYDNDHKQCSPFCAQFLGSRIVGDRFGHSVTGSIRLNGRIRKVSIREDRERIHHKLYESANALESFGWALLDQPLNPEKRPIRTWSSDAHSEVLCLEMHSLYSGLLLSPESPGSNRYMRIGMFHQWGEPQSDFEKQSAQRGKTWDVFTGNRCNLELV